MIVIDTKLGHFPPSCLECQILSCNMGSKKNKPEEIKKLYCTRRHEDCPLLLLTNGEIDHDSNSWREYYGN